MRREWCRWKCKLIVIRLVRAWNGHVKVWFTQQQWVNGSIMISHCCGQCSGLLLLLGADGEMEHLSNWPRRNSKKKKFCSPFKKLCKCGHDYAVSNKYAGINVQVELWICDLLFTKWSHLFLLLPCSAFRLQCIAKKWQQSIGCRINKSISNRTTNSNCIIECYGFNIFSRNLRASRSPIKVAIFAN